MSRKWEACIVSYSPNSEEGPGTIQVEKSTGDQIDFLGEKPEFYSTLAGLIGEGWEICGKKLKGNPQDTFFLRRYLNSQSRE